MYRIGISVTLGIFLHFFASLFNLTDAHYEQEEEKFLSIQGQHLKIAVYLVIFSFFS